MSFKDFCNADGVIRTATESRVGGETTSTFVNQPAIKGIFNKLSGSRVYVNNATGRSVVATFQVPIGTVVTDIDHVTVAGMEWIIDDIDDPGLRGWCKVLKLANI